ncbi:MAG TPA: PIN domain-containing protein [Vicinamibacterales bacterium]|nr:PIN domain-containing protein [Vicinamibacterales bacterium]
MSAEHSVSIDPGPRHWEIVTKLCRETDARGNLVADAYLAALAIESGSDWISTDRDCARRCDRAWNRYRSGRNGVPGSSCAREVHTYDFIAVHCPFLEPLRGGPGFPRILSKAARGVAEFAGRTADGR